MAPGGSKLLLSSEKSKYSDKNEDKSEISG